MTDSEFEFDQHFSPPTPPPEYACGPPAWTFMANKSRDGSIRSLDISSNGSSRPGSPEPSSSSANNSNGPGWELPDTTTYYVAPWMRELGALDLPGWATTKDGAAVIDVRMGLKTGGASTKKMTPKDELVDEDGSPVCYMWSSTRNCPLGKKCKLSHPGAISPSSSSGNPNRPRRNSPPRNIRNKQFNHQRTGGNMANNGKKPLGYGISGGGVRGGAGGLKPGQKVCRFYKTAAGCRFGNRCWDAHC